MPKTIIHVNQHVIKSNRKTGQIDPVLTVKTYKSNTYAHEAIIKDKDGSEVARIVYNPQKPLSCGAHVWIQTQLEVETRRFDFPEFSGLSFEKIKECVMDSTDWKQDGKGLAFKFKTKRNGFNYTIEFYNWKMPLHDEFKQIILHKLDGDTLIDSEKIYPI